MGLFQEHWCCCSLCNVHCFYSSGYTDIGQHRRNRSRSSPERVFSAELTPLCTQNHHHLGHCDLGVLGCDERPGGEVLQEKLVGDKPVFVITLVQIYLTNWLKAL